MLHKVRYLYKLLLKLIAPKYNNACTISIQLQILFNLLTCSCMLFYFYFATLVYLSFDFNNDCCGLNAGSIITCLFIEYMVKLSGSIFTMLAHILSIKTDL